MTWRIFGELNELYKEEPYREKIKLEEIERIKKKRYKKELFRKMLRNYLRQHHKPIQELTREDIAIITDGMNDLDKTMFMDQVKYTLETNYGKPIKRIIDNHKSVLFSKQTN